MILILSFLFQVRMRQEFEMKVRNFLPPENSEPEIFILNQEGTAAKVGFNMAELNMFSKYNFFHLIDYE